MPSTDTVSLQTPDGAMPAFVARPDGPPRGGVVVIQEAFGVTSHIEDVARRCADAGYAAAAPHLFHRSGSPVFGYDDIAAVRPLMAELTGDRLLADADAALAALRGAGVAGDGGARLGIVGFCMGGTVAMFVAARRSLDAAVTFYGGGVAESRWPGVPALLDLAGDLRAPWLGLYGDEDQSIPVEQVERLRAAVRAAPVETELVRYPEAGHGFHCDDRPAAYRPEAARDAWRRALAWFDRHLGHGSAAA